MNNYCWPARAHAGKSWNLTYLNCVDLMLHTFQAEENCLTSDYLSYHRYHTEDPCSQPVTMVLLPFVESPRGVHKLTLLKHWLYNRHAHRDPIPTNHIGRQPSARTRSACTSQKERRNPCLYPSALASRFWTVSSGSGYIRPSDWFLLEVWSRSPDDKTILKKRPYTADLYVTLVWRVISRVLH